MAGSYELRVNNVGTGWRPEVQVLLCCARTRIDPATSGRIRGLLQQDIEWDCLIRAALNHGVLPLLYRSLLTTCPHAVPAASMGVLRQQHHANACHNLRLAEELARLLELLECRGISIIAYKGPALAVSVYGNLSLRQFGDLDILVRKRDAPKVKEVLITQGYRLLTHESDEAIHHYHLLRDASWGVVEVHWRAVRGCFPCSLETDELLRRAERVSLASKTVLSPGAEDLLLILCAHGTKHGWDHLEWICDVAEVIRAHQGLQWARVVQRAGDLGCRRMLFLGLHLARDLLGARLPEAVLRRMEADLVARSLAVEVSLQLFRGDLAETGARKHRFNVKAMERFQDRVRYLVSLATSPQGPDLSLLRLPSFLRFFYYVLRPIRLAAKYTLRPRTGLRLLRGLAQRQQTPTLPRHG
jgi:hypothetical protein